MAESALLPEHPELRMLAQALEDIGAIAEIFDDKWRIVFTSSEDALARGLDPAAMRNHYGLSLAVRPHHHPEWVTGPRTRCFTEPIAELTTNEKAIRDAGSIAVAEL
ncbi:hypothetical protein AWC05_05480 [Mycobacterium florentinum]|uniref:Uncharacterized protein n=1 Tax=Mycobacterium florentinum TaxID=292462 RepID=A0A1X1TTT9_MYCFL|nr:hypothetical protein [Mycobacterium florentinum]MCV7408480.1 hypothetical protein [Mycobacterium florentinum]ORV48012.1 hypothetical protein AWC05_05480 [Mycobacterium florentinum]BBX78023.1 hypothetical protein MFLOJ_18100 [Mycobacterium florentinum]